MFQAHLDESGTDGPLFVLAGYIATAEQWANFSYEWERVLNMSPEYYRRLEYFKASEMRSDRDKERLQLFYRVIEDHCIASVICVIPKDALIEAIESLGYKHLIGNVERLRNPYYLAFKACLDMIKRNRVDLGITSPVDFYFDDISLKANCLEAWDYMIEMTPPSERHEYGQPPAFRDEKVLLPLQAADFLAYFVREWEQRGLVDWPIKWHFPWRPTKAIPFIGMRFDTPSIKRIFDSAFYKERARANMARFKKLSWN